MRNRFPIQYILSFLLCSLATVSVYAQRISIHHPQLRFLFEDSLLQNPAYHSALQPLEITAGQLKSIFHSTPASQKSLFISPVIDAAGGYSFKTKEHSYQLGQGTYMAGSLGKKAGFELSAVLYEQKFPDESYSIDSLKLVPRNNRPLWSKGEQAIYGNIRGNIWWQPNRWLTFKAGNDKFFIGDGQQSLLLSENTAAYPFFQTKVKVWKIQYQHQVMFMRDLVMNAGSERFSKYSSQHILSFNATSRLNFYIFEAVIWRSQDSLRYRRFDPTYLNPFIFYRPVEFNQGMADNVLMGLGGKLRIWNESFLYGQFALDEFRLKEYIKQSGWWASKYAFQTGFKTFSLLKNRKSVFLLEYNQCRPFTYAHLFPLQNYAYLREPLAHPQGSNFREVSSILRLQWNKEWFFTISSQYMVFGTDLPGTNLGSDLYMSQKFITHTYGNSIGQGIKNQVITGEMTISKMLKNSWRLQAFTTLNVMLHSMKGKKEFNPSISLGLNTMLYD